MKLKLFLILISICMTAGCSTSNEQNVAKPSSEDGYELVRKAAWEFIQEKGWSESAKGNWQNANVERIIADEKYEMLNAQYEGKEVEAVSFHDKENIVIGAPLILVDFETNEVVGYLPSE